jgi:hypothetical protein
MGRRAARAMERHSEHLVPPLLRSSTQIVDWEQDIFPPIGRDRQSADFEIYEEPPSRLPLRRWARRLEQLLGDIIDGNDEDMAGVLGDIV